MRRTGAVLNPEDGTITLHSTSPEILDVASYMHQLGTVERKVLLLIARRLLLGQGRYGMLQPDDPRDWARERGEEAADWLVYDAVSTIMGREASK